MCARIQYKEESIEQLHEIPLESNITFELSHARDARQRYPRSVLILTAANNAKFHKDLTLCKCTYSAM